MRGGDGGTSSRRSPRLAQSSDVRYTEVSQDDASHNNGTAPLDADGDEYGYFVSGSPSLARQFGMFLRKVLIATCGCLCVGAVLAAPGCIVATQVAHEFVDQQPHWDADLDDASTHGMNSPYHMGAHPADNAFGIGGMELTSSLCACPQLAKAMHQYGDINPWKLVRFPSRGGPDGQQVVSLAAWWLPAEDPAGPRVVVQHGLGTSFNSDAVLATGYMLRSMGFSVLLPSFRDHGASGKSDHQSVGVGWDYPYDLLGAWDYAVQDPDGELGGASQPGRVGIMGFSWGGYVALIAFGLEPKVPAAWVDAPPLDIWSMLGVSLAASLGPLASMYWGFTAWTASRAAGVPLDWLMPQQALATGAAAWRAAGSSKPRPVGLAFNLKDEVVPLKQATGLLEVFGGPVEDAYEVREVSLRCDVSIGPREISTQAFFAEYSCNGKTHCRQHLWKPGTYRRKLCRFWRSALNMSGDFDADCGISARLPDLPDCPVADCATGQWTTTTTTIPNATASW